MEWGRLETPIGPVTVGVDDGAVRIVRLTPDRSGSASSGPSGPPTEDPVCPPTGLLAEALTQLRAYFAGESMDFTLPVVLPDRDRFAHAVWTELTRIPYGETRTYGEVAAAVRAPSAARAVGVACHRNPVPLVVPCHRVVGAGGKLVGFGAGLPRKRWLLELEARVALMRAWS